MRPSLWRWCGPYRGHLRLHRSGGCPTPTIRWLLLFVALAVLAGCADSSPTASPLRLPTRVPRTPPPIPTPTPTPFSIAARTYYEEGMARQETGDLEGALQSFTWAIQQSPDFAPAYVARGTIYLAQGEYRLALADADVALEIDPANAPAYALRGETLRLLENIQPALEAFERALELDSDLKTETFHSRWLAAREDNYYAVRLLTLSSEYADIYPDDPLRYYYRGWAFIELGHGSIAAKILIKGIEATPDPPALLWFALGQAYAASNAYREAVTALEVARALVQTGDTSLVIHSDQPIVALFSALGRAYLGAGRCVDAETMLEYAIDIGAPMSEHIAELREARLCQTPTPETTPTPTPTPG